MQLFCFLAAPADCSDTPENGGDCCSFEAIRFLDTRCSQILHTRPLIHQVANHYINKRYIWSCYKSRFQLFRSPGFFLSTSLTGTFTCTFVDTLLHIHSPIPSKTHRKLRHVSTRAGGGWCQGHVATADYESPYCVPVSEGDLQESVKVISGVKQEGENKWKLSQWAVRSLFSRCICIHGFPLERCDSSTRHSWEKGEINIFQMLWWRLMEEVVSGEVLH